MYLDDLSSVTVHKEGGLLYGSVKEDAVAADYPLVDGSTCRQGPSQCGRPTKGALFRTTRSFA